MLNVMAWVLFGTPLIIASMLMIRGTVKQRAADLNSFRAEPRVTLPLRNPNVDTTRSGFNDRYFSSSQNRDRAMTSR
jgi:hypothetical protein